MPRHSIEQILQQRMGLHSSTVGSNTIARAVEQRMRSCAINTVDEYRDVVTHSDTELDALIEAVIIPETWFFREPHAFEAFSDWVRNDWIRSRSDSSPLRILSVPCSSGEEPYTLAMCLAQCGITVQQASIDAVDISNVNLQKARQARYTSNSFRGHDLLFRDRYFDCRAPYYYLRDEIRERVDFRRGNILDSGCTSNHSQYHVIFCRNLLIYFDRPTQYRAIDQLETLLDSDGLLFLGHSETSLLQQRGFTPITRERCFGFRRSGAPIAAVTPPTPRKSPQRPRLSVRFSQRVPMPVPFTAVATGTAQGSPATAAAGADQLLSQALQLADQGHTLEAAACCEKLLTLKDYQVDAYYLLGVISEAEGNLQQAEQLFRKAVYLQPDHYEALVHLSVICAKTGDQQGARRLRERASRARARQQQIGATK